MAAAPLPARPRPGRGGLRTSWTAAEDDALRRGHATGDSDAAIAASLGRSQQAVRFRRSLLGLGRLRPPQGHSDAAPLRSGAARRLCLMCQTPFASSGAGNRICPRCKSTPRWRAGDA